MQRLEAKARGRMKSVYRNPFPLRTWKGSLLNAVAN